MFELKYRPCFPRFDLIRPSEDAVLDTTSFNFYTKEIQLYFAGFVFKLVSAYAFLYCAVASFINRSQAFIL